MRRERKGKRERGQEINGEGGEEGEAREERKGKRENEGRGER